MFKFGRVPGYFGIFKQFISLINRKKELNTISTGTIGIGGGLFGGSSIQVHWTMQACDPWCCVLAN